MKFEPSQGIELCWRGTTLAVGEPPAINAMLPIRVVVNGTHASVWQNRLPVFDHVALPSDDGRVAVQSNGADRGDRGAMWRFIVGGNLIDGGDEGTPTGDEGTPHTVQHLRLLGAFEPSRAVPTAVRESPNGQQYGVAVRFDYLPEPVLSASYPAVGALRGGTPLTITGRHLGGGDDNRCRFETSVVATVLATWEAAAAGQSVVSF